MAKNSVYEFYEGLTPGGRVAVVIGGSIVAIIIVAKIYKGIKNAKAFNLQTETSSQAVNDLKYFIQNGINPSYPDSQYQSWSLQITEAISGCGSDFLTITNVFQNMQNEADVLKLISTFGSRQFNYCMQFLRFSHPNMSLPAALAFKLSSDQLLQIDNILSTKGIKYRF